MSEAETNLLQEPSSEVTEIPETTPKPFLIRPVPALAQEVREETQQESNLGADSGEILKAEDIPVNERPALMQEGLQGLMSGASGAADLTTPPTAEETEDTAIMAGKREGAFDRGGTGAQMPGIDPELSKQPDPDSLPDRPATAHKTEEFVQKTLGEATGVPDDFFDAYKDSGRSPRQPGEASNYLAGLSEEELDEREDRIRKVKDSPNGN